MNDQAPQAGVQPPAPTAPPAEQPAAEAPPKRVYSPCPDGSIPEKLMLELDQNSKIARCAGDTCPEWQIEFLRGNETDPEKILEKAHAAWEAAPRPPAA